MKISREEKEFTPIPITIETQDELDCLCELSGSVYGCGEVRDFFDAIFARLSDLGGKSQGNLRGSVEVK